MKLSTFLIILVVTVIITVFIILALSKSQTSQSQKATINLTPSVVASNAISESKNIEVSSPKANQVLKSPIFIKGKGRVFENSVNYRLKDNSKIILTEGNLMTNASDAGQFGDFEITLSTVLKGKMTVEVFSFSAKDGSEIDKVIIPIVLQ